MPEEKKYTKAAQKNAYSVVDISKHQEKTLVGNLATKPELVFKSLEIVKPEQFFDLTMKRLYEILIQSQLEGIDIMTLVKKEDLLLKYTDTFMVDYHPWGSLKRLCAQIVDSFKARSILALFSDYSEEIDAYNLKDTIPEFHKKFIDISVSKEIEKSDIKDILVEYEDTQKVYSDKMISGQKLIGFSCGFEKLDNAIDGFRPGHLWTIGGYTSTGKTFLSLNMVSSIVRQGKRVVYYSLEMSKNDIISRILGIMCKMNGLKVLKGILDKDQSKIIVEAKAELVKSNMAVHADLREIEDIRLSMLEETLRQPVDVFMLDYIQLVSVKDADTNYDTMRIAATAFQSIAKELGVPILLLSQVSNETARGAKDSQVIGFKGAGDIAAVSDIAGELVIDEDDKDEYQRKLREHEPIKVRLNIKKNRHGEIGGIPFEFDKGTGVFYYEFKESKDFDLGLD